MCDASVDSSISVRHEGGEPSASVASAGLVSPKTSGHSALVSFGASVVAERRIKRLKRSIWAAGHLLAMAASEHRLSVCWFVTLTYVGVDDWQPQHIARAIRRFRRWCRAQDLPCRYAWVAELQRRGAVHYHLLAWLPVGTTMPHWDLDRGKRTWWPHGMSNTQPAKAGVGYLMKYLSKLHELYRFPKGLRLYGMGGLCKRGRAVRAWQNLPEWAKREHGVGDLKRHAKGLAVEATGELLQTPWKVQRIPDGLRMTLTRDLAPRFHDGPYSTWPRAVEEA